MQAIIFDLDDTLYPEHRYVRSGMEAVARWASSQFGFDAERNAAELMELVARDGSGRTFNQWLDQRMPDQPVADKEGWVNTMIDIYRRHTPSIAFHTGVEALLVRLRQSYRLGVVTDGYLEVQQRKVAALGLESLVDAVVCSDQWGRASWKPNIRPYQEVLRLLGVEPKCSVYVGDNPHKDFRGARTLGMRTARGRYRRGLHVCAEPATAADGADVEVADLRELLSVLEG